jgi:hypothetical protein
MLTELLLAASIAAVIIPLGYMLKKIVSTWTGPARRNGPVELAVELADGTVRHIEFNPSDQKSIRNLLQLLAEVTPADEAARSQPAR